MPAQLVLRDQVNGRTSESSLVLDWQDSVPLTGRTLISERVRIEWEARETRRDEWNNLKPLLNPDLMRPRDLYGGKAAATLESMTTLAIDGFGRNAFFLVVDGHQVTDLDEALRFRPSSQVTFVRLVPLRGG